MTDTFQAIADPSRRQILKLLSEGTKTMNGLVAHFKMSRPAVSKHVKVLYEAGMVAIQDEGRERKCSLREEGFSELRGWVDYYEQFWKAKMTKLDEVMSKAIGNP